MNATQQRVLDALRNHLAEHGDMPTAAELAAAVGMRSENKVRDILGGLVLAGHLRHEDSQPGRIRIVEGGSE